MARDEDGYGPPYGSALDLGTGSGVWGVRLARRGWLVTGIDIVEKALRRARERVEEAGVDMRLVQGDVTSLRQAGVGSDFRLVLDTGTFHGLTDAQRACPGWEITDVEIADTEPDPWRGCSSSTSASTGCGGSDWAAALLAPRRYRHDCPWAKGVTLATVTRATQ